MKKSERIFINELNITVGAFIQKHLLSECEDPRNLKDLIGGDQLKNLFSGFLRGIVREALIENRGEFKQKVLRAIKQDMDKIANASINELIRPRGGQDE